MILGGEQKEHKVMVTLPESYWKKVRRDHEKDGTSDNKICRDIIKGYYDMKERS